MMDCDEDALICDLAETYGILEPEALPIKKLAVLSCGLRDNSRIKLKLTKSRVSTDTLILAAIFDAVAAIANSGSRHKSLSMVDRLTGKDEAKREYKAFRSSLEFEKARMKICQRREQQ